MATHDTRALAACYEIIETTGDLALCRKLYPEVIDRLLKDVKLQTRLHSLRPPEPEDAAAARQALLDALKRERRNGNGAKP
jgi:hypothetical protein